MVDEENFFHQRNREDQKTISGSIKAAGWGGPFPFSSPNHVLSCWLEAPQPHTGSSEEHRRRTKRTSQTLTGFRKVMTKWAVWSDANLMTICLGNSVRLMVEGRSKGRNREGLEQSHIVAVWQWAEASSPWSEKQKEDDAQQDLGALCGVASWDPTLVLNSLGRLEIEIQNQDFGYICFCNGSQTKKNWKISSLIKCTTICCTASCLDRKRMINEQVGVGNSYLENICPFTETHLHTSPRSSA